MWRRTFHSKLVSHFHAKKNKFHFIATDNRQPDNQTTQKHTQKERKNSKKKQNDSNTEKKFDEVYKPYLIKPISFKDSVNYVSDREFTIEELAQITSETIVWWLLRSWT